MLRCRVWSSIKWKRSRSQIKFFKICKSLISNQNRKKTSLKTQSIKMRILKNSNLLSRSRFQIIIQQLVLAKHLRKTNNIMRPAREWHWLNNSKRKYKRVKATNKKKAVRLSFRSCFSVARWNYIVAK